MSGLEGARKCSRCPKGLLSIWTVWGRAGRRACDGGFQFEYSVEEHAKKNIDANDMNDWARTAYPLSVPQLAFRSPERLSSSSRSLYF